MSQKSDIEPETPLDFSLFYFSDNDNPTSQDNYELYVEGAREADRLGFSAIWTPERHFTAVGAASPNPSVLSAAAAMVTSRIQLRAGSVVLPLHNSVRVAEEWAVVDRLSGGRVGISFASGWVPDDFIFAPGSFATRQKVMMERIDEVRRLWRGESLPLINGAGETVDIAIRPRPVQRELPVWLTAASSLQTFEAAGAMGANVLTALFRLSLDQLTGHVRAYREARRKAGHDPSAGIVSLMLHTYVSEDEEEALALGTSHLKSYFQSQTALREQVGKKGEWSDRHVQNMARIVDYSAGLYLTEKSLIGSPRSCLAMVGRIRAAGVDEVCCLIDFGIENAKVLKSLKTLDQLRTSHGGESLVQAPLAEAAL